jgi:glycosyltransferase involved in cell wall biosynthesis
VFCPANYNAHKNHDTLLVAWSRFERRREHPLMLVGEGLDALSAEWSMVNNTYWRQDRLIGLVHRCGLQADADYYARGYVSTVELRWLMRHAAALIMPSLAEGGGSYPVEEALDSGIPVLCSDLPVLREHLDGRSAEIGWFDPYSPESMVKALNTLFDDYSRYKASAERAAHDRRPTWDEVAAAYVRVFEAVRAEHGVRSDKARHAGPVCGSNKRRDRGRPSG